MQTYELRLESPDSEQHRILSVGADSEQEAREIAEAKELALVSFDLHAPSKEVWENPYLHGSDDARVDLNLWDQHDPVFAAETAKHTSHEDAKRAGVARLDNWANRVQFDGRGKIVASDLGSISKARYAAHLQQAPYEIVSVDHVTQQHLDAAREAMSGAAQLEQIARRYGSTAPVGIEPLSWIKIREALRESGRPIGAVTAALYGVPTKNRSDGTTNGQVDWHSGSSDTFKVMAASNTYTPDLDAHAFKNATGLTTNEVTGTNWSAGGVTLGTLASSYDSSTDQARYDAADISVATVTISGVRYFAGYKSTGTDSTSALIFLINCGADVAATAGTLTVAFDATGAWLIDVT